MTVIITPDADGPSLKQLIADISAITGDKVTTNGSGVVVSDRIALEYLADRYGEQAPAASRSAVEEAGPGSGGDSGSASADGDTPAKSTPARKSAPAKKSTPAKKTTAAAAQRSARSNARS